MSTKIPFALVILGLGLTPVWITMISWFPVYFLISTLGRLLALG
jgi:hypothetical protein